MCTVAERCVFCFLAETKPDAFIAFGGIFLRRESTTMMRAVAKRLRFTLAAGAPPIVLAFFDIEYDGVDNGSFALAHDRPPHAKGLF